MICCGQYTYSISIHTVLADGDQCFLYYYLDQAISIHTVLADGDRVIDDSWYIN